MHLIYATEDFKLAGRPRPGFPILLWEDMGSCWEANEFLRYYLSRGSIGSQKSWPSTGRALYDYFSFLEAHELRWNDVDRGEDKTLVAAYRDYCFEVAKLSRNTVRQRLMYICEFYEFAQRESWISTLPFRIEERRGIRRPGGFLQHLNASGGTKSVRSVMPRMHKTLPKFLTKDQTKSLLAAASNPHHHMIIRMALQSGLRREELATFPLAYVFDPRRRSTSERNVRVVLDPQDGSGMKTKGSVKRTIIVSRRLMEALHHYAVHWRGERASLTGETQAPLFLNQEGLTWAADGQGIEAMVRKVGERAKIKTHPHMLRHTYATHTLVAMQRHRGDNRIEPLVFLQKQLGHASINTTMIYLHLVNELADDAVLAYDDELNDWANGTQP
ncbi:tyrosine-type recombinase/integrase [Hydrogenophaga intermedia]|uniref:Phage integrase n=1 Tax=Hydrogenophaga intermedia TaxID=65786 RepID=A0A1L1PCC6_HYDIT|nr:tyrosine-type recombinase/integrase [Hydrogenophaga intermedia]TMU74141.1 site-specific integrase [Hydrogenophaga intermedia]CDN87622.1 Phage integrase [Hydrogenophaga intermedia]